MDGIQPLHVQFYLKVCEIYTRTLNGVLVPMSCGKEVVELSAIGFGRCSLGEDIVVKGRIEGSLTSFQS